MKSRDKLHSQTLESRSQSPWETLAATAARVLVDCEGERKPDICRSRWSLDVKSGNSSSSNTLFALTVFLIGGQQ
jgi:hypothetical protein